MLENTAGLAGRWPECRTLERRPAARRLGRSVPRGLFCALGLPPGGETSADRARAAGSGGCGGYWMLVRAGTQLSVLVVANTGLKTLQFGAVKPGTLLGTVQVSIVVMG